MKTWWKRLLPLMLVAVVALVAACGDDSEDRDDRVAARGAEHGGSGRVERCRDRSCRYGGGGGTGDVKVVSDLPLQGASGAQSKTLAQAMALYLEQQGGKAGSFTVTYESKDDSTAAAAKWDPTTCSANAQGYAGDDKIVGVLGTFNSGCAKLEVPILNQANVGHGLARQHRRRPDARRPGHPRPASRTATTRPASATTRASSRRTTSRVRPPRSSCRSWASSRSTS